MELAELALLFVLLLLCELSDEEEAEEAVLKLKLIVWLEAVLADDDWLLTELDELSLSSCRASTYSEYVTAPP